MLTFESASVLGINGIIEKLAVCICKPRLQRFGRLGAR